MRIKINHIPFHSAWGRSDEIKTPHSQINYYDLEVGKVLDLEKFKIKIVEVDDTNVKAIIFDNDGVLDNNRIVDYKNNESYLTLKYGEIFSLHLHVMDAMESWDLSLTNE